MKKKESDVPNELEQSDEQIEKKFKLNWNIILIAAILIIAVVAIVKLVIWNAGTKSDYDPNNIAEGFDIEPLDTIIPLSTSKLEGREDDGILNILCLGGNPLTDETGSKSFTSQLAKLADATVYNGGFPNSTIGAKFSAYNSEYPRDNFTLPYVAKSISSKDFSAMEQAAATESDPLYKQSVETLKSIDYDKIDMLVIMYDATDYLEKIPSDNPNDPHELSTYTGGLRNALEDIQEAYPHIRIFVMSHTYAQSIDENGNYTNGGTTDLGNGTLPHYLVKEVDVSISCGVSVIDNYYGSVNEDNYNDYMTDYLHLNNDGRKLLAERLVKVINMGHATAQE